MTIEAVVRGIVTTEQFRLIWTVLGALGTILFLILAREARLDHVALTQVRPPRLDFLRMHTRGELQDVAMLTLVIGCMAGAGAASMMGVPLVAVALLVISECLLVALGFVKLMRRRAIFRSLRLSRKDS